MDHKNYYKTLNVLTDATVDQIRAAFKRKAVELHQDKNHSEDAVTLFQKLNEAYSILSDPQKRERYDAGYDDAEDIPADFTEVANIFQMFFNGGFAFEGDDEYDSDQFYIVDDEIPQQFFTSFQYDDFDDEEYEIPFHLRFSPQVHIQDSIIVEWSKWKLPYNVMQYKLKAVNLQSRIECTLYKGKKTKVSISGLELKEKYYFIVTAVISETEKISTLESKTIQIPSAKKKQNKTPTNRNKEPKPINPQSENLFKSKENKNHTQPNHSKNDPKKKNSKNGPEKKPNGTTPQNDYSMPELKESSKPTDNQSAPPKICSFFKQGTCRKGKACKFLHQ